MDEGVRGQVEAMRVKQIKAELDKLGVPHDDAFLHSVCVCVCPSYTLCVCPSCTLSSLHRVSLISSCDIASQQN